MLLEGGDRSSRTPATRAKLERCGLDYLVSPIARNLTALFEKGPP